MNIEKIIDSIAEYWNKEPLIAMAAIATILSVFIVPPFKAIIYKFNSYYFSRYFNLKFLSLGF